MKVLILNTDDCKFFTLFSTPHFTDNMEIAQTFKDLRDAQLCAEQYLDSGDYGGFDAVNYELVVEFATANGKNCLVCDYPETKLYYEGHPYSYKRAEDGLYLFTDSSKEVIYLILDSEV